ncbi:MAG: hypothetical protein KBC84_09915, partial [Proteobacteria bacterium]|nr:hypothetical protein [Pseudomonadota bacterium]
MGSSLHKSTLREKQEVAVVLPQVLASNSSTEKSSTQMPELPRSEETKIKSPISFFIDQIKDLAYNSPKFIEASAYLIGTAITLCATPVVMLWSKKGYLETKDSILTPFVEFGRNTCNKYTWCGSLLGNDREFITITDSQVKDNLNPFKWMGDSILSSVMHTIDWGRATGTRLIYNFVTKQNINAEEFRALESENPLLRTTKFVSDLLKAGVSLLVLKKLGAKSTIDELIKPITVAAGMSAANVIGEKWQEDKSCLSVDTIENTVAGTANSLIFMAGMRYSAHSWVNSAQTKKVYQSRSEQAQRVVENIDLIDSIPDLVKALHKARNELLDDNNYKNKNVWNHLGHLLTASSAAMDAGELNLSGVSNYKTEVKLNTSEKLQTDALKMRLIN